MNNLKRAVTKYGLAILAGISGGICIWTQNVAGAVLIGSCLVGLTITVASKPGVTLHLTASTVTDDDKNDEA
jgi:hypothetical protein